MLTSQLKLILPGGITGLAFSHRSYNFLDATTPTWQELEDALKAVTAVVHGLVEFTKVNKDDTLKECKKSFP